MNYDQIEFLRRMIIRYNSSLEEEEKNNLRNEIFVEISPFMLKWISAILSERKIFLSKEDLISKSWDCFEYCIQRFKPEKKEISVPSHFYRYTKYYLNTYEKSKNITPTTPQFENYHFSDCEKSFGMIDELKAFREILDEEYVLVFDDALMSLVPANKEKQYRIKESSLSPVRYQESKKIFKFVIDFLLRR